MGPPTVASLIEISVAFNQISDEAFRSSTSISIRPENAFVPGTNVSSAAYFTGRISSVKRSFGGSVANPAELRPTISAGVKSLGTS